MASETLRSFRVGGVPEHFNLPWHLAIAGGRLGQAGLQLQWSDYATGTGAMLADLADGRLDAAILLTEGAALGLARELPVRALTLYTTTPLIWGVHVPPNLECAALSDLRGRRFAISRPGSGSHLMSLALAIEQGWPVESLSFEVVNDMPGAIEAFRTGRAEVFLWEHFTTAPLVESGTFRRVGDFLSPWPAWVVCVGSTPQAPDRHEFGRIFDAVTAAAAELRARPDCAALIADRYGLREEAVAIWLTRTEWVRGIVSPGDALQKATAMLRAAGAIPA